MLLHRVKHPVLYIGEMVHCDICNCDVVSMPRHYQTLKHMRGQSGQSGQSGEGRVLITSV